jgi:hypothetical protein
MRAALRVTNAPITAFGDVAVRAASSLGINTADVLLRGLDLARTTSGRSPRRTRG